jgi:lysophospholipase L1-like esterase
VHTPHTQPELAISEHLLHAGQKHEVHEGRNWARLTRKLLQPGSTVRIVAFGGSVTVGYRMSNTRWVQCTRAQLGGGPRPRMHKPRASNACTPCHNTPRVLLTCPPAVSITTSIPPHKHTHTHPCSYPEEFVAWLRQAFPDVTFELTNLARRATAATFAALCLVQELPADADLVLIEYSVNGFGGCVRCCCCCCCCCCACV